MQKLRFLLYDIDYVDFNSQSYIRLWGISNGKKCCFLDTCDVYFYVLPKQDSKVIAALVKKIEQVQVEHANRIAKVTKVEVEEKNFIGKPVKAIKVYVSNHKDLQTIKDIIKQFDGVEDKQEVDISYVTRYLLEKDIALLHVYEAEIEPEHFGIADIEGKIKSIKLASNQEEAEKFMPKILAFDIEASEFEIGKGKIVSIALANASYKKVITWKKLSKKPDFVEYVQDEKELLKRFIEIVKEERPEILVGYFSDGFDMPYLRARADENKLQLTLGLDNSKVKFVKGLVSSAKIAGIVHIDLFKFVSNIIATSLRSETLTLNEVASELIGEEKIKIDLGSVIKQLKNHNIKEEELLRFFAYNLQDAILTSKLFMHLWPQIAELTRIVGEPLFNVARASYSQLVEHYIMHNLKQFNEIIHNRATRDEIQQRKSLPKYAGAFVLQPKPGLYENIAMFDFRSLYPSIITSFNICVSTITSKPENKNNYYATPEFVLDNKKVVFYFAKPNLKPGFIASILKQLMKKRNEVKEQLKKQKTPLLKARYQALKTLANATYGYFAFFGARWYSRECAASITAFGRHYIKQVMNDAEKHGFKVVYGDSIAGDTKVIIMKNNQVYEIAIEDLFEKIDQINDGKEYNFKKDIKVLTLDSKGKCVFKPIKFVMRHKTDKKMYRVYFTNNWYIDVTEDHSLIGYLTKIKKRNIVDRLVEVKPTEIHTKVNSIVSLKKIPIQNRKSMNWPRVVYEFIGYFIGDGSFDKREYHRKDYYLDISFGKDKHELIKKLIIPLKKLGYVKNYWEKKGREGDIKLNGKIVDLVAKYFKDENGKKCIPTWLLKEKEGNIAAFLRGLFSADGTVMQRKKGIIIKYNSINNEFILMIRKLLFAIGVSNSCFSETNTNKYKSKHKIYSTGSISKAVIIKDKDTFMKKVGFLIERKNKRANVKSKSSIKKNIKQFEFDLQSVKKIEPIKYEGYVYDIEVEGTHRFFANYVLVHNTDSLAIVLDKKTKQDALAWMKKINDELPGDMQLELEAFYERGIFVTTRAGTVGAKKKYAFIDENNNLKIRGFETVRRDWCKLAKEVQDKVLSMILQEGNANKALEYVQSIIAKLRKKQISIDKLIIKTQVKKALTSYEAITPHVVIARKLKQMGIPIRPGSVVEYVIAETKSKKALIREKARLPEEVRPNEYDADYYIEHQIIPAVENIFAVFGISKEQLTKRQRTLLSF